MFSETEKVFCINFTEKLKQHPLATCFLNPVDSVDNYLTIIKKPMDLGTVSKKLKQGKYSSVQQWEDDLLQIWKNAKIFNGEDSLISNFATILNQKCLKAFKSIPKTPFDVWNNKLVKTNNKLIKLYSILPNGESIVPRNPELDIHA